MPAVASGRVRPYRRDGHRGLEVHVDAVLPHAPAAVFDAITIPDQIRAHPGVAALVELEQGTEVAHGPGALREVTLPSGRYQERVLDWAPPRFIVYDVEHASVPIDHHGGQIHLTETEQGTQMHWRSAFTVQAGWMSPLIAWWAAGRMANDLAWHIEVASAIIAGTPAPPRHGPRLAWVLVPVGLWNVAFAGLLPESIGTDVGVPAWLLGIEHVLRIATVALLLLLRAHRRASRAAWALMGIGVAVYMASWVPLLVDPSTADVRWLALGPAVTPLWFLAGLARLGRSWLLLALALGFWVAHVVHVAW